MAGPYTLVIDGQITAAGDLPFQARRLSDNVLITDLPNQSVAVRESCGWYLVDITTNPRPADTATTTWSSGFVLVAGRPVEQWTEVTKTPKQIEGETRDTKAQSLDAAQRAAYARLDQIVDYNPPAITSNAIAQTELAKTMAAVQDMSAIVKGLVRRVLGSDMLDATKD